MTLICRFSLVLAIALTPLARAERPVRDDYTVGTPWTGTAGITERTSDIMERSNHGKKTGQLIRVHSLGTVEHVEYVSPVAPVPPPISGPLIGGPGGTAQTVTNTWLGATLADTLAYPPDTMGAIGPAQFIVVVNGRIRSFNKVSGLADGAVNADTDAFFASVMTPTPVNFTSDPRIRYDRLSQRWFIIMLDVPNGTGATPNRIMFAVSDGPVVTASTAWTFYQFQHDQPAPQNASDTGKFADYPTLGLDANALYIGVNIFGTRGSGSFANTTVFVVRKSSLLSGGPIVVTAFRKLIGNGPSSGPYTPQGVDNYDPAATEGYVIGVDANVYGKLQLRRISNPGGTPSISGNIAISLPTINGSTINVPHLGNTGGAAGNLDGLDYRLLAAHYRNGRLWTTANLAVDNAGASSAAGATVTRMGVRWYELNGIVTGQTPGVVQSGTLFDPSPSTTTNRNFWMGTAMVSGQGHVALGFSVAGPSEYVNAGTAGRLQNDPVGTMRKPLLYTASSSAYNPLDSGGNPIERWGDYSYTSLDPNDDMTMWTIQEFCVSSNYYGVQIAKLLAPPPATPASCNPASLNQGTNNAIVTLVGTSDGDTGFFDPGAGFSNRIATAIGGSGVTVNSITYNNPTNVTLNLSVAAGAAAGLRTVTVTNPDSQSATSSGGLLTINGVSATNHPPVLPGIANKTVIEGSLLAFTNAATDPDGNALAYSLTGAPAGASVTNGGVFTWTPNESQGPGTNLISMIVTDNGSPSLSVTQSFTVFVLETNSAPTLPAITDKTVFEGQLLAFTNSATDSDLPANTLTYSLVGAPVGASVTNGGVFTWTPNEAQGPGTNLMSMIVTDNGSPSLSVTQSFTVFVLETNSAPVLPAIADKIVFEGQLLAFTNSGTDSDLPANALSYSLVGAPSGAGVTNNGVFTWTPSEAQGPGTNLISMIVTDNGSPNLSVTQSFTVFVLETNSAPTLPAIADKTVFEGQLLAFTNTATDSDLPANTLTYSLVGTPAGASVTNGGVFTWAPNESQGPGTNLISMIVTDNGSPSLSVTQSFTVFVLETNSAPTLPAIADKTVFEGQLLAFTNSATDSDLPANTLTYSLVGAPAGASVTNGGVFTWAPSESQGPGTNLISMIVTDNGSPSLSVTQSFTVFVLETNSAPTLPAITDKTVFEGQLLGFTNSATDSDLPANTLTYSLIGAPAGASVTNGGVFTWTPNESQGPGTNLISMIVTDNGSPSLSVTQSFTVFVLETNSAPVLPEIADRILHATMPLVITNVATDPDLPANTLTYSLDPGAPIAASINNGIFQWTSTDADAGTTNSITVRVTDNGTPALDAARTFQVMIVARPTIESISLSNDLVTVSWNSINAQGYRLQYTPLLELPAWLDIPGDVSASGSAAFKTDPDPVATNRFYRVLVLP